MAYTDGSCFNSFSPQRIGAGVFIPSSNTSIYIHPGEVGVMNTINRAELTGIAAALTANCKQIATDSACSLSQIRKQLVYPEMQRKHTHSKLLEHNAFLIEKSVTPILFFKVKAHTGIIENECADTIAKHAAVHDNGHDVALPPPTPDGNPYSHMYWIASGDTAANNTSSNIRLTPLQINKDKLKHHMSDQHRLGDAKIETGSYQYWKGLLNSVND